MSNLGNNQRLLELKSRLQNPPQFWNGDDVLEWLRYIGLEQYAPTFSQLKIDGYLILDLTEEDLEGELQVGVKLHRKKMVKAIQELKLLEGAEAGAAPKGKPPSLARPAEPEATSVNSRTRPVEQPPQAFAPAPAVSPRKQYAPNAPFINIISLEGPTDVNYRVSVEPVSIGRHSSNQISIIDESVSRHHARIDFDGAAFQLQDVGSTTGTFIKVQEPLQLREEMIVEIGSYQFQVSFIHIARGGDYAEEESHVELTVYESPDEINDKYLVYSDSSIGRKSSCTLSFPDDLHMSNLHCKFNLVGERFMFEDIASTNGSWLRLSKEGVTSPCFALERDVVFKIGNTAMYKVRFPSKKPGEEAASASAERGDADKCCICWDGDRDCLIMPCRHNVTCTKCVKSVKFCPFCREFIKDIIKIYK